MIRLQLPVCVLVMMLLAAAGCSVAPRKASDQKYLHLRVGDTIKRMKAQDPGLKVFFEDAFGYAVFAKVSKGAIGVGGAHGRGEVYRRGELIGRCDLRQGTVGLQLGGQAYSEVIFFESQEPLARFMRDELAFSAQASAVAVEAGSASAADYDDGVAVFALPTGGLMFEASIGGQSFRYVPK